MNWSKHKAGLASFNGIQCKAEGEKSETARKLTNGLGKLLPSGSCYEGVVYSPPSSHGDIVYAHLMVGFSDEQALKEWVTKALCPSLEDNVKDVMDTWLKYGGSYLGMACVEDKLKEGWVPEMSAEGCVQTPEYFFKKYTAVDSTWYNGPHDPESFIKEHQAGIQAGVNRIEDPNIVVAGEIMTS